MEGHLLRESEIVILQQHFRLPDVVKREEIINAKSLGCSFQKHTRGRDRTVCARIIVNPLS